MAKEEKEKKKKIVKKDTKKNVKKEGLIKGIKKELKVVNWPSAKEIIKYTIATIVFCIVLVAFFEVLNIIMAYVKGLFN